MINEKELKQYNWQKWIERDWQAFSISLFKGGETKSNFVKIGAKEVEMEAFFFQYGFWYQSELVWDRMSVCLLKWLKRDSIFGLSQSLKKFHFDSLKKIEKINQDKKGDISLQLDNLREILCVNSTYIWMAHGLERVYKEKLDQAIKKHQIKDSEKFIGDISFPRKKNFSAKMSEAILRGDKAEDIHKNFAWVRIRDGFSRPYSIKEIKTQMKEITRPTKHQRPRVPNDMKKLVAQMQELVFFRTERTDVFYHLLFSMRPFLKRLAKHYNIKFEDLRYYTVQSLINGQPKKYNSNFSVFSYQGSFNFYDKKILKDEVIKDKEIKGTIAYKGSVSGLVKIVTVTGDLSKVKQGDILVTQMTFPAYMIAMNKASAFVTDEGGITCHAAIVAREMKKPCIIGTRIATKVLKDGDMVEVDANRGIINKLK